MNSIDPVDYIALKFKNKVRILYALLRTTPEFYPRCTTYQLWASYFSDACVLMNYAIIITFTLCSCSEN